MKINQYRRLCMYLQQQAWADTGKKSYAERLLFEAHRQFHRYLKSPFLDVHHATRSIYVHVPKTGGNSVTQTLYHRRSKLAGSHRAAWEYQVCDEELFSRYYVFATVRHPLTRMRSAFYYLKCGGMNATDRNFGQTVLAQHATFIDFIRALDKDEAYRQRILRWLHFLPQSYFLCDTRGRCIVPHLLRQENFSSGLAGVCTRLGISYQRYRENPTPGRTFSAEDLSELAEGVCYRMYQKDYVLLGYAKKLTNMLQPVPSEIL